MTLTKEKNNTHKQRTLPNNERLFRGSNVHETGITDAKTWHSLPIHRLMRHSCDQALTDQQKSKNGLIGIWDTKTTMLIT